MSSARVWPQDVKEVGKLIHRHRLVCLDTAEFLPVLFHGDAVAPEDGFRLPLGETVPGSKDLHIGILAARSICSEREESITIMSAEYSFPVVVTTECSRTDATDSLVRIILLSRRHFRYPLSKIHLSRNRQL